MTTNKTQEKFPEDQTKVVELKLGDKVLHPEQVLFNHVNPVLIGKSPKDNTELGNARRIDAVIHFIKVQNLISQYMYSTTIITNMIQNAKLGLLHPSLLNAHDLLEHFTDIKLTLPTGIDLPTGLSIEDTDELIKLSELTIYQSLGCLVFIVNIPLVYQQELNIYQIIPKPVDISDVNRYYMYIKNNYDYCYK